MGVPHHWSPVAANNGSSDPNADLRPGRPGNTVLGAIRGLMATAALARNDGTGTLVAALGANNVYSVSTNEGLLDPTTQVNGLTPAITSPFLIRVVFDTPLTGSVANPPKLKVDGAAAVPLLRRDGSALGDGDLSTTSPVEILGDFAANTDTTITRTRVLGLTPSDVASLGAGVGGGIISGFGPSNMAGAATGAIMQIGPGACADSTASSFRRTSTALNWSVTNGAAVNGYDGGRTLPSSATLGMFLIWGTAGIGCLASQSLTGPVLPTGYSYFRLLFPFMTDSTGSLVPFTALEHAGGALTCYLTPLLDARQVVTAARVFFPLTLPVGVVVEWHGNGFFLGQNPPSSFAARVTGPFEPDIDPSTTFTGAVYQEPAGNPVPDVLGSPGGMLGSEISGKRFFTNTGQLSVRGSYAGSGLALYLTTTGFTYFRRL